MQLKITQKKSLRPSLCYYAKQWSKHMLYNYKKSVGKVYKICTLAKN